MDTLAPLTLAAGTTALVMYPVDVARALKMASAGGEVFSFGDFVKTHGVRGLASQGALAEIVKSSLMRVSKVGTVLLRVGVCRALASRSRSVCFFFLSLWCFSFLVPIS